MQRLHTAEPLGEQIARNLQAAIERLHDDIDKVEFWTDALQAFLQPVPGYELLHHEFLLDRRGDDDDGDEQRPRGGLPRPGRVVPHA